MSWFGAIAGCAEALYAAEETRRAQERARAASHSAYYQQLAGMCGLYSEGDPLPPSPRAHRHVYTETKCHSCGASDWRPHDGKEVCAYCRSDRV